MREMIYIAVSVTNGCSYCVHSHTAGGEGQGPHRRAAWRTDVHHRARIADQRPGHNPADPGRRGLPRQGLRAAASSPALAAPAFHGAMLRNTPSR
ncbi:MAG: carboxymuconolactone decarboxylase family protein [Acetobacteraceae bacterium]